MRRCRKCNSEWPDTVTACPNDGWSLTIEADATYHPPVSSAAGPSAATAMAAAPAVQDPVQMTDLVPGFVVGEYKIDKKIGEGGMGAVYSATHPMIGKRAAIKVISAALGTNAEAVGRFVQEARSVNQIGHPNIVDVFAFGELPDGRNYFVMEYLQGESLADRLGRAAMPLGEAIEILDQVADALEAAHEKQIVHRDLKPDNVYLAAVRGGRTMVKLLDFGIAKLSLPDGPGSGGGIAKTRTGMMMGTPGYLSPEQARGKNVDHRTDIYALGCMTFEIVCGRLPFIADNAMDIVLMHMTTPPVRASAVWPEIPAPLDDLIARMLEKDPAARPTLTDVRAVFAELVTSGLVTLNNGRGIAFGSGISRLQTPGGGLPRPPTGHALAVGTHTASAAPTTQPPGQLAAAPKKKGLLIGVIAGVVLLGGAGAFLATQGGSADKPPAEAPPVAAAPTPVETPPVEPQKPAEPATPDVPVVAEAPKPATVEIVINVRGAEVTIDGKPVEVTGKTAKASVETEGTHTIAISAAGREPFETTVETKAGGSVKVIAKLERARSGGKKPAVAGGKKPTTTTTTTPAKSGEGSGSGSAKKPTLIDKNAPINPF